MPAQHPLPPAAPQGVRFRHMPGVCQTCGSLRVVLTSFSRRKSLPAQSRLRAGIDFAHQQASKWRSTFQSHREFGQNRIRNGHARIVRSGLALLLAGRGQPGGPDGRSARWPISRGTLTPSSERWARRGGLFLERWCGRCFTPATGSLPRACCTPCCAASRRDRLDLLGEEYFHYVLKPQLKPEGVEQLARVDGRARAGRAGEPGTGPRDAPAGAASWELSDWWPTGSNSATASPPAACWTR